MLRTRDLKQSAKAAYLGLAVGDALGATVEFLTPREILHHFGVHQDIVGGGWLKLRAGHVTDDTTMSLALGNAIIKDNGEVIALSSAQAFDEWMRTKPVDIGNTVRRNLIQFRRTGNPEAPLSEFDAGNGALMRMLPAALATIGQPHDMVMKAILAQAHVTHNNPLSDAACLSVCHLLHAFLEGTDPIKAQEMHVVPLLRQFPLFDFRHKRIENPSGYIVETIQAVFQALFETKSFEQALIDVVNRGGDADTTGAITGMLAGALYGLESIPSRWINALDPKTRTACENQAAQLIK
jgi:ADP-ribosyl-[dinitrogen reductase] hydrolase